MAPNSIQLSIQQPSEYLQLDAITLEALQVARLQEDPGAAAAGQTAPMTLYKCVRFGCVLSRCAADLGHAFLVFLNIKACCMPRCSQPPHTLYHHTLASTPHTTSPHPEDHPTPPSLRMLNRCRTKAGARLLKANLLQPPAHLPTIQLRQQAIAELLAGDQADMLCNVGAALSKVPPGVDRYVGCVWVGSVRVVCIG